MKMPIAFNTESRITAVIDMDAPTMDKPGKEQSSAKVDSPKAKYVYHRMICGLHIEADEGRRWWNENNEFQLAEDHSMVHSLLYI